MKGTNIKDNIFTSHTNKQCLKITDKCSTHYLCNTDNNLLNIDGSFSETEKKKSSKSLILREQELHDSTDNNEKDQIKENVVEKQTEYGSKTNNAQSHITNLQNNEYFSTFINHNYLNVQNINSTRSTLQTSWLYPVFPLCNKTQASNYYLASYDTFNTLQPMFSLPIIPLPSESIDFLMQLLPTTIPCSGDTNTIMLLQKQIQDTNQRLQHLNEKLKLENKRFWREKMNISADVANNMNKKHVDQVYCNEFQSFDNLSSSHYLPLKKYHVHLPQSYASINGYQQLLNARSHDCNHEQIYRKLEQHALNCKRHIENIESQCEQELKQVQILIDNLKNIKPINLSKETATNELNIPEKEIIELKTPKIRQLDTNKQTMGTNCVNETDKLYRCFSFYQCIPEKFSDSSASVEPTKQNTKINNMHSNIIQSHCEHEYINRYKKYDMNSLPKQKIFGTSDTNNNIQTSLIGGDDLSKLNNNSCRPKYPDRNKNENMDNLNEQLKISKRKAELSEILLKQVTQVLKSTVETNIDQQQSNQYDEIIKKCESYNLLTRKSSNISISENSGVEINNINVDETVINDDILADVLIMDMSDTSDDESQNDCDS